MMVGNHELVSICKGLQDIPKTSSMSNNSLEKTVFGLESHRPKGSDRTKFSNELRIVFQEMVLWFECFLGKHIKESPSVF